MNNKLKIIIGMLLIFLAFICTIFVFYFIDKNSKSRLDEVDALQVQITNLISEKSEAYLSETDLEKVKRPKIELKDVLARADVLYGPEELRRRDGILWIDRKGEQYIITLGIVNGLVPGSYLVVYEEARNTDGTIVNKKVDDIIVQKTYDLISYVKPAKQSMDDFNGDYYRVTIKNSF